MEETKKMILHYFDLLQNQDYEAIGKMVHPDYVFYPQIDTPYYGAMGLKEAEKPSFDAFPDFVFSVQDMILEGNKAACIMLFEGTHTGADLKGIPATGAKVRTSIEMWITLKDGMIIEKRAHYNMADVLGQIGADLSHLTLK